MKITDLTENECIHCATEEEAKRIEKIASNAGLYVTSRWWGVYKDETVFYPKLGCYCNTTYAKDHFETIYPSTLFQSPETDPIAILERIGEELNEKFESDPAIMRPANVIINEFKKKWNQQKA